MACWILAVCGGLQRESKVAPIRVTPMSRNLVLMILHPSTVCRVLASATRVMLLLMACAVVGACKERSGRSTRGAPTLVLIDSVTLAETDSAYVAEPNDLAIAPDGSFFIADKFAKRVHHFARNGQFIRPFGRSGEGPGEFANPSYMAFAGDSLLFVVDRSEIEIFDMKTAEHVGAYRTPRRAWLLAFSAGRLFAGYADPARNGSIATIEWPSSELHLSGPLPALLKNEVLFPMFNSVAIAVQGNHAATAFGVTNYVYLSDVSGGGLDSIWVPARRRNGVDPEMLLRFSKDPTSRELGEAAVYGSSGPLDLHWMSAERIALVNLDWRRTDNRLIDSSYVSVIDTRTRHSCVDARIPGPTDPPVNVGLRGDTIFVIAQDIDRTSTRASTTIRAYRIDTSSCQWVTK